MKKLLVILGFAFIICTLFAHFVENMPYTITQPDGSTYEAFITGDEYYRRVHDENNYTMLVHPRTGYIVYAIPDGDSITHSEYIVGQYDPSILGISPGLLKKDPAIDQRRREQQHYRGEGYRTSPIGTINNIVGFVRFSDQTEFPTDNNYTYYQNMFNSTSQSSLKDYYNEVSNSQLSINSILRPTAGPSSSVVSIVLDNPRGYYSPYNEVTNPIGYTESEYNSRLVALATELVEKIEEHVPDYLDYDNDDDGRLDGLTFIFRGEKDNWGNILWPTRWGFSGSVGTIHGVNVRSLIFQFETSLVVRVLCHEMGHEIGFPDFYHKPVDNEPWSGISPVGAWCLMSNGRGHSLVYSKLKYGTWFASIPVITPTVTPTTYTLEAIDQSPFAAYKILSSDPDQFYIVEYRRKVGRYEYHLPATGLIIYRVQTSYDGTTLRGNINGPPDEIYIYRPGGTIDVNGILNEANYSNNVGRTEIHNYTDPKPWLYIDNFTTPDGDLVITDVGPSGDPTITFMLRDSPPNVWTGDISTNWHTAGNWLKSTVPGITDDVIIPEGQVRYPVIADAEVFIYRLKINSGASVEINANHLNISDELIIDGQLIMTHSYGNLIVNGDVTWLANSSVSITHSNADIYCNGNMVFEIGSNVQMELGYVEFTGSNDSTIINNSANTQFHHLISNKTAPGKLIISSTSFFGFTINGNLWNLAGSTYASNHNKITQLKGNLTSTGSIAFTDGELKMNGESQTISFNNSSDHLINLTISPASIVNLNSDIEIRGSFNLVNGFFNANSHTIRIRRDWNNTVGPHAFIESSSRVVFYGSSHDQTCNQSEDFHILEIDKPGKEFKISGYIRHITCAAFKWTAGTVYVGTGSFTANSLLDDGIVGSWSIASGVINLHNVGSSIDLNGDLNIHGGEFNVYGGISYSLWPATNNSTITMSNGVLDFKDQGVRIHNNPIYTFTETITGGTIKIKGNLLIERPDFNPSAGIIELYGSNSTTISQVSGSSLCNLYINKEISRYDHQLLSGSVSQRTDPNIVTALTNLNITGQLWIIEGILVAPPVINISGDWINSVGPEGFTEGSGLVVFYGTDNSYCYGETFNNLELNKSPTASLRISTNPTYCNSYNWTSGTLVADTGVFNTTSLADNGIAGHWLVYPTGIINVHNDGYIDLNGNIAILGGEFNVYGGSDLSYWSWGGDAFINMSGGILDFKDQGIRVYNSTTYTFSENITGGVIRTVGDFVCNRSNFNPTGGALELYSSFDSIISMVNGANVYDLHINKNVTDRSDNISSVSKIDRFGNAIEAARTDNTVTATTTLNIAGSMLIENGVLIAPPIIQISGDWTNLVGPSGFEEGNREVIFTGTGNSSCYGEHFYLLNVNKSGSAYLDFPESVTECDFYKWTSGTLSVSGGTFTANDLFQVVMRGDFSVSDGIMNLHQSPTGFLDLWGSITMSGGEMNLTGGDGTIYWPSEQGSAIINMSDGVIEMSNHHLFINSETVFTLTDNITGGTIRTVGNFYCDRADFNPMGGTFYLHSANDSYVLTSSGSPFNVVVDKIARENESITIADSGRVIRSTLSTINIDTRSNSVVLLGNFNCSGSLIVYNGTFKLNGYEANVGQHILVHDKILMNSNMELLRSGWNINWYPGSLAQISNGEIQCYSNWFAYDGATVQLPLSVVTVMRGYYGGAIRIQSALAHFGQLVISVDGQNELYVYSSDSTEPLKVLGNLNILSGNELRMDGNILRVGSNINISNGAKLSVQNNQVEIGNNGSINVNLGGTLTIAGTVAQNALITHTEGHYNLNVYSGGTISANRAIFEYTSTNGINIMDGAIVDPVHSFHNCTFRNGIAEGTLLTINNNQTLQVNNAIFPANTWSGTNNVRKTLDQGSVTFNNVSGAFSGDSFEDDLYSRIAWVVLGYVDLEIIDIDWSISNPYVGDTIILSATVANNGTMDIPNPVYLDLYFNLDDAPTPRMVGDLYANVTSVTPGSPIVVPFEFEYYVAENWNSWFQIDTDEEVDESDELNNTYGPIEITWLPLPPIDDLTILYSSNNNAIQLQWSYPLSVDNFNIYKEEDPYFTAGPENLIVRPVSTLTTYYELVTGPRSFYRITVERFPTRIRESLPPRRNMIR
ncbi:MAG: M6 family metalloprotease domain-containing protein [Candidatus Cloacimonetes bacterium]|nr:M6 family metalloprotease domain-containing protein [Candidatus Cloacimonadota bacterium]